MLKNTLTKKYIDEKFDNLDRWFDSTRAFIFILFILVVGVILIQGVEIPTCVFNETQPFCIIDSEEYKSEETCDEAMTIYHGKCVNSWWLETYKEVKGTEICNRIGSNQILNLEHAFSPLGYIKPVDYHGVDIIENSRRFKLLNITEWESDDWFEYKHRCLYFYLRAGDEEPKLTIKNKCPEEDLIFICGREVER